MSKQANNISISNLIAGAKSAVFSNSLTFNRDVSCMFGI